MNTINFIKRIIHFFRLIFHFRKPEFAQLEITDLIIQQSPLLLISWHCHYPYSIHIKEIRFRSLSKSGVHILKLHKGLGEIHIELSSMWRKTVSQIKLNRLDMSPEVFEKLLDDVRKIRTLNLHSFNASIHTGFLIKPPLPILTIRNTIVALPQILLDRFDYHSY